ncbi:MAG: undecaprenyldiphospho-muramoylpentapeptide beta-N-acetylglucosaminyltransferase [Proteobacteria bacterium]|nr:undecaprenyldiphospho-muramoylpentapeptide beta-N-acetylglucosaminyltransferase [Pseudomonadota bacterium]
MPNIRLLLTGGGTGGHLFPAVAAAQEFLRQMPETQVLFIGTRRKLDTRSLAVYGFASDSIRCYGLKGKSPLELLKALAVLPVSFYQAGRIIRHFRPNIILGVGGYVTGPVVVAGKIFGIPTIIHEQNSVPGLANRKLGSFVDRVCLSLPESAGEFPGKKISYTGNPVRRNILDLAKKMPQPMRVNGKKSLLVLGGSQGAQPINRLVSEGLQSLPDNVIKGLRVIHQTGDQDLERIKQIYVARGIESEVQPFFNDMADIYSQADLLVSRAGATTLAEVAVLGKPAILIPYPFAADNHQEKNGNHYAAGGGAIVLRQSELTFEKLAEDIAQLIYDENKLITMGMAMKKLAFPDAAEKIVECCLQVMKMKGN